MASTFSVQAHRSSDDSFPTERLSRRHTATDERLPPEPRPHANLGRRKSTSDIKLHSMDFFPTLLRAATLMVTPEKKISKPPSTWRSIRSIIFSSWFNVLLVFIPISWAVNFALPDQHSLIFVLTFLAIIPLAKLLAYATDELSIRVGQTLAGLLNATLGNAVEMIVSIIALTKCELTIVQSSLVGSILSNLLLVLGMCFFAGGMRFSEQGFGQSAVQLNSSLLTISVIAVLLPGAFQMALQGQPSYNEASTDDKILKTSHGVALILLFIYGSYLVFQLFSHKALYNDNNPDIQQTKGYDGQNPWLQLRLRRRKNAKHVQAPLPVADEEVASDVTVPPEGADSDHGSASTEDSEIEAYMSIPVCLGLLVSVTVLVAVTAEFLVDSISGLTATGAIGQEFVALILLPIVGNAAEHVTAVTVSVKDKLTLSLGVAVGSSIQIALFVIPFMVTLAWIMGKRLTLLFDPLESIVLLLSVITVNYTVQDGKSNWLEGMILMCLYLIVAVTFWFYPGALRTEMFVIYRGAEFFLRHHRHLRVLEGTVGRTVG
ncbi:Calcium/proton exchanger [Suillus bovinus]|uniref:Calcium/proton exchanger n=1 Tax=Suillus bovinus TaxID=48563 RepID=UPI001B85E92B|nr:Calcium/proton exchanger [Suillus bovinus]KAG2133662.1 Calcium/proton exchanger [Suillus bovinus]